MLNQHPTDCYEPSLQTGNSLELLYTLQRHYRPMNSICKIPSLSQYWHLIQCFGFRTIEGIKPLAAWFWSECWSIKLRICHRLLSSSLREWIAAALHLHEYLFLKITQSNSSFARCDGRSLVIVKLYKWQLQGTSSMAFIQWRHSVLLLICSRIDITKPSIWNGKRKLLSWF